MQQYYTLKVAGLTRQLPLCAVSDKMDIAAFIMFSDVELTVACAKELLSLIHIYSWLGEKVCQFRNFYSTIFCSRVSTFI